MCQNQIELGQSSCYLLWLTYFLLGGAFHGQTQESKSIQKSIIKTFNFGNL